MSGPAGSVLRPAADDGPLARLEGVALRVFGGGDRPAGWFVRKLAREAVDPALSWLAVAEGAASPAPLAAIHGYVLVGREPGETLARTAGVGVVPGRRGAGLGGALIGAAARGLARAGVSTLRVLAEPERVGFYARAGLRPRASRVTLLSHGTGPSDPVAFARLLAARPPGPWSPDPDAPALEVCAWRAGTWARTPPELAATLSLPDGALAHVSREGAALLVHRLLVADAREVVAVAAALRSCVPEAMPLLLYGCDEVSSITASLAAAGWAPVQRAVEMELDLRGRLDNHEGGDDHAVKWMEP